MHRNRGFTLLEVLVATILLTVGVVALMRMFSIGMFASTDVESVDLALNIAQAKMEEIKNTVFGDLADSGPTAYDNFSDFNVEVDADVGSNPMQVDVIVTWTVKGETAGVTLTTLMANY